MYKEIIRILKQINGKTIPSFMSARKLALTTSPLNEFIIGMNMGRISGSKSSTNKFLSNQVIAFPIDSTIKYETIGNIDDAYMILINKIREEKDINFTKICELVCETVNEYFGHNCDLGKRLEFFSKIDSKEPLEISNVKELNIATCTEKAILSHNLLKFVGISSTLKISPVINDGINDMHAYNLLSHNDKAFVFDSSIPRLDDGKVTPLIALISNEEYELLSSPLYDTGSSVTVTYDSPIKETHTITYDSGKEKEETYNKGIRR